MSPYYFFSFVLAFWPRLPRHDKLCYFIHNRDSSPCDMTWCVMLCGRGRKNGSTRTVCPRHSSPASRRRRIRSTWRCSSARVLGRYNSLCFTTTVRNFSTTRNVNSTFARAACRLSLSVERMTASSSRVGAAPSLVTRSTRCWILSTLRTLRWKPTLSDIPSISTSSCLQESSRRNHEAGRFV